MSVILTHPQGAQRKVPDDHVDAYLSFGWERATAQPDPEPSLSWKRADLAAHATELGLDVREDATKRQILAAINEPI